VGNPGLE
jgi:hypothetical protein